jgi:Protein of unknown function (DUF4446)
VVDFFSNNASAIALVLAGLCLLGIVLLQSLQINGLKRRLNQLTGGSDGGDLEAVLGQHLETVHQVGRDLDELTARTAILESSARHHFARQGLIRFNPFPDTGGNQSFVLALLDESDDGFVVSSLHSRTGTRIYAKAVSGGKADTSLSEEEQEAIDEARSRRPMRPATPARSAAAVRAAANVAVPAAPKAAPAAAAPAARSAEASAPAPAAKPAPAAAKTAPAPAPVPAPAPAAKPAPSTSPAPAHETAKRAPTERAKGQEKPKDVRATDTPEVDADRVANKPGVL